MLIYKNLKFNFIYNILKKYLIFNRFVKENTVFSSLVKVESKTVANDVLCLSDRGSA